MNMSNWTMFEISKVLQLLEEIKDNTKPSSDDTKKQKPVKDILITLHDMILKRLDEKTGWSRNELKHMLANEFSNCEKLFGIDSFVIEEDTLGLHYDRPF